MWRPMCRAVLGIAIWVNDANWRSHVRPKRVKYRVSSIPPFCHFELLHGGCKGGGGGEGVGNKR